MNPAYPLELKSLGDYLRRARIDQGLSQPDVAKLLKVRADTVTGWELNRHVPTAKISARIIQFIGYNPFENMESGIGTKLLHARMIIGDTQCQVANALGCDESNIRYIELGIRNPGRLIRNKLMSYIEKAWILAASYSLKLEKSQS